LQYPKVAKARFLDARNHDGMSTSDGTALLLIRRLCEETARKNDGVASTAEG